jgi:hypothetical protein
MLIAAPWTSFWDRNYFATLAPWLRVWLDSVVLRGTVTAVGVVTVVASVREFQAALAFRRARLAAAAHPPES